MKFLNSSVSMYGAFGQLIRKFQHVSLAVAWVRFVKNTDGAFHPKIYLFENSATDWACIVGSADFSSAAFGNNDEASVLFGPAEDRDGSTRRRIDQSFSDYWNASEQFNLAEHSDYRIAANARGQPSGRSEAQYLRQRTVALMREMEGPHNEALELAGALELIGNRLPSAYDDYASALLAIGEMIKRELNALNETRQKVLAVNKPPSLDPYWQLNARQRANVLRNREE